jgi:hypothetical protein
VTHEIHFPFQLSPIFSLPLHSRTMHGTSACVAHRVLSRGIVSARVELVWGTMEEPNQTDALFLEVEGDDRHGWPWRAMHGIRTMMEATWLRGEVNMPNPNCPKVWWRTWIRWRRPWERGEREREMVSRELGWAFDFRFGFGSVPSVIDENRFLENRNWSAPKNFRNRAFRFLVISVRFRF